MPCSNFFTSRVCEIRTGGGVLAEPLRSGRLVRRLNPLRECFRSFPRILHILAALLVACEVLTITWRVTISLATRGAHQASKRTEQKLTCGV